MGGSSGLGAIGKPGPEVVQDPSTRGQVHQRPQPLPWPEAVGSLRTFFSGKARQSRSSGFVQMSEARASTRSAQRWERLICQDRIRAACSGASSPPSPTQSGPGAPGIFGARHAVSRCARAGSPGTHHVHPQPLAGTLGVRPGTGGGHKAKASLLPRPACASLPGGRTKWPNPTSPCPLGRQPGSPAGARGRRPRSPPGLAFCFSSVRTRERQNSIMPSQRSLVLVFSGAEGNPKGGFPNSQINAHRSKPSWVP